MHYVKAMLIAKCSNSRTDKTCFEIKFKDNYLKLSLNYLKISLLRAYISLHNFDVVCR